MKRNEENDPCSDERKKKERKKEIVIKSGKKCDPRIFFFRLNSNFFNRVYCCEDHFRHLIDLTAGNLGSVLSCPQSSTEYLIMASLSKIFAAIATYPYQVVRSRLQVTQICYTCFPFDHVWLPVNHYQWFPGNHGENYQMLR